MGEFQEDSMTIVSSTMFKLTNPGEYSEKYHYSRYGNPTRDLLESSLASLDYANYSVTFCSSTAAYMAILSLMKADDLVVFSDELKCWKLKELFPQLRIETMKFDNLKSFEENFNKTAKMVWIESLTSPLMKVVSVKAIADVVHRNSQALLVVDNSILTPHNQKPLELAADIVVYSLNEFVGGHDDVSMGAVVTNDKSCHAKLRYFQVSAGAVPSPFDCFLINRSLKTLPLRMDRQSENSLAVAKFLKFHPKIGAVFLEPLDTKEDRETFPAVLSFCLEKEFENCQTFLNSLKLIKVSQNFGGFETSAVCPWSMTHSALPEQQRLELGITKGLIKLSVGLQKAENIIEDLSQAFDQVKS